MGLIAAAGVVNARKPDLVADIVGTSTSEQPIFRLRRIKFNTPDGIRSFHRHGLGIAEVVADDVGLGGEIRVAGGNGPAEQGCPDDAHEEQHHDDFDDGEAWWTAHPSTSQVSSFPRPAREGQRGGGVR